jgi:hypothetical protein
MDAACRVLSRGRWRSILSRILARAGQNLIFRRDRRSLLRPRLDRDTEDRQAKKNPADRPQAGICGSEARAAPRA